MSEKSDPTHGEPLESHANGSPSKLAEEYKVGPGRPPADKRWQKGGPSPNPRGRPRKEQSMLPDLRKVFEQAMNKKVSVLRGDKTVLMTKAEIGLEQLFNQFAKGDRYARRDVMAYAGKLGIDFLAKHGPPLEEALSSSYRAILDRYVARQTGAGNVAPAKPVLAPAELLDDEPDETEQPESSLRSPPRQSSANEMIKEKARQELRAMQPSQKLDQASHGAGRPPPGGYSVTTGKPT
jgi:hypothetical protein